MLMHLAWRGVWSHRSGAEPDDWREGFDPPPYVLNNKWLKRVAGTPDTDLRAHRVALTYHYFARALDSYIYGEKAVWPTLKSRNVVRQSNANWFNFGTWATVTINRDLGLRRATVVSSRFVPNALRRRITPIILNLRAADGQRISRALSWGQRLVFLSTTYMYLAKFGPQGNELYGKGPSEMFDEILEQARWGRQTYLSPERHLRVVSDAFEQYALARQLTEIAGLGDSGIDDFAETMAARCILRANLMITAVEQDVVNAAVAAVIDHVPALVSSAVTARTARWGERFLGVPREITGLQLPYRTDDAREVAKALWARLMTDQLLVLTLPTETLRLGRDIPPVRASKPYFPAQLADLASLPGFAGRPDPVPETFAKAKQSNARLHELVEAFDRARGGGQGSAANDWRRYDERMSWALNLLRSRQQELSLFWSPYSIEDQERILDGRLPQRTGDPTEFDVQAPVDGLPAVSLD